MQKNQLVVFPVSGIDSVTVLSFARGRDDEYQNDYAKAEVIEEFLTGNTVRTDSTSFTSSLSGTVGRFGGGCDAKLSQSIYIFGDTTMQPATIFSSLGPLAPGSGGSGN